MCLGLLLTKNIFATAESYFNNIKNDPNALYIFLKAMPKGADLHFHLTGGYPEVLLEAAFNKNYCLSKESFVATTKTPCTGIDSKTLATNNALYEEVVKAWSLKDFQPGKVSSRDHFFNAFFKFNAIANDNLVALLVDAIKRAFAEHIKYLEVMVVTKFPDKQWIPKEDIKPTDFDKLFQQIKNNKSFEKDLLALVKSTKSLYKGARENLGCSHNQKEICNLSVLFQYYLLREKPLNEFFANALLGFEAASRSPYIVALNIVQPEDGLIALKDYSKQMAIIDYFHKKYPKVPIALHAGELSPDLVWPKHLQFHIREAIKLGHARRIGHGVSIAYEEDAEGLLKTMAQEGIAVEINLTSNEKLLNIAGVKHPLKLYLASKVPVVLSTDDEGLLRTDLTREYRQAVLVHKLNYAELKAISRDSLTYSFLPGESLWLIPGVKQKPACEDFHSKACLEFTQKSRKANLQRQLELDWLNFEKKYN